MNAKSFDTLENYYNNPRKIIHNHKGEALLPTAFNTLNQEQEISLEMVATNNSSWFGLTYKEDCEKVSKNLKI